jgi:ribosome maturation protein Sdo1
MKGAVNGYGKKQETMEACWKEGRIANRNKRRKEKMEEKRQRRINKIGAYHVNNSTKYYTRSSVKLSKPSGNFTHHQP